MSSRILLQQMPLVIYWLVKDIIVISSQCLRVCIITLSNAIQISLAAMCNKPWRALHLEQRHNGEYRDSYDNDSCLQIAYAPVGEDTYTSNRETGWTRYRLKVSMTKSTGADGGFFLKWWIFERNKSLRSKEGRKRLKRLRFEFQPSILDFPCIF